MKNIVKKGFSLIELLVVVAIVGILAGIAIVGYNSYVESAKDSVNEANASTLARKIAVEKSKPVDFKTNTYGEGNTFCVGTTVPASFSSDSTGNTALANSAACYARAQGFDNMESTLTTTPAAGKLSVGSDTKVYWKNVANTETKSK
jgi:type IV pilus assembly protein PilA